MYPTTADAVAAEVAYRQDRLTSQFHHTPARGRDRTRRWNRVRRANAVELG